MGALNNIVSVAITRQTSVPSRAGFGTGAFVSAYASFTTATKSYASYTEMSDDVALVGADSLAFGAAYFGQQVSPTKLTVIKDIGDSEVGDLVFDASLIADNSIVATLDSVALTAVPFTSDNATTLTALAAAIQAKAQVLTAVSDGTDTITVTFADKSAHTLTVAVTGGVSQASGTYTPSTAAAPDFSGSLSAAVNSDNDWYALCIWSRAAADITATAIWVQAQGNSNPKMFFAQSSDAAILTDVDTDIASTLKASAYYRTSVWYHATDSEYLDGGVIGGQLPSLPGSITWAYKSVSSVAADTLTSGQKAYAHGKACNTYDTVASTNITEEGKVSDSPFEWIDVIRGVDWIQVNLAADLFTQLVNSKKIPFDTSGIALIGSIVKKVLSTAQGQGILSVDVTPTITLPTIESISAADKGNRVLNGVSFTGVLAGAVQKINIVGTVTL
jgi:VCBS repeat-containing protein